MTNLEKYRQLSRWEDTMPEFLYEKDSSDIYIPGVLMKYSSYLEEGFTEDDWDKLAGYGLEGAEIVPGFPPLPTELEPFKDLINQQMNDTYAGHMVDSTLVSSITETLQSILNDLLVQRKITRTYKFKVVESVDDGWTDIGIVWETEC